jgi:hypothetical protein
VKPKESVAARRNAFFIRGKVYTPFKPPAAPKVNPAPSPHWLLLR